MATIQIRELPEEAYEVIRRRARREGRSIQSYMRAHVIAFASEPTKQEALEDIERILAETGGAGRSAAEIVADVHADRR